MTDSNDNVRIQVAFEGGQSVGANVSQEIADALAAALAASEAVFELDGGRHVLLSLGKVVYVRRLERETQVGFAAYRLASSRSPASRRARGASRRRRGCS